MIALAGMLTTLRVRAMLSFAEDMMQVNSLFSHIKHVSPILGEALIVCVVVSCPELRPLHIRPKKSTSRPLVTGDEHIEIVSTFSLYKYFESNMSSQQIFLFSVPT